MQFVCKKTATAAKSRNLKNTVNQNITPCKNATSVHIDLLLVLFYNKQAILSLKLPYLNIVLTNSNKHYEPYR
ncbi:hypothetical protein C8P68_104182 [Mucilaginibacter yixingensis]|uniref:Uncharacterized protein n=1 Tax=Mucilaginibacter yixingensis TaxID=1295612 RepID=A0A2T5J9F9_9SPHI|nr:hypothetical protein C8P68_104182 [Mucilaginibacter yixingensis]